MQLTTTLSYLLLTLPTTVHGVFRDEVDHIDYHRQLIGLPHSDTTFFHRPRKSDKASLLYTLSDVGVVGAVNPSNGEIVWRQALGGADVSARRGHLRAAEGESWLCSAYGSSVQSWDAVGGRSVWSADFVGEVKDLEIVMEPTASKSKDVLLLFDDEGSAIVRRLRGETGAVVWEFSETTGVPLQVSINDEKVFVVALYGTAGSLDLRVTVLDAATGRKTDDIMLESKGAIEDEKQVLFVGANSASPIIAWSDARLSILNVNILGTKTQKEILLPADVMSVEIHASHLVGSQPHFLVHAVLPTGHKADVYSIEPKTKDISHAYELPLLPGKGAFSAASIQANVYFIRVTQEEIIMTSSASSDVLGRWDLTAAREGFNVLRAVSEVVKKSEDSYAVRTASVTPDDDWVLVRNGEISWVRPEGLSGGVAAVFAEIPDSESLAENLELEAHSNPVHAFVHRFKRHCNSLQFLPSYLASIPQRLTRSVLGTESMAAIPFTRDSFGFRKLVILATKRGKIYCLDTGDRGGVIWHVRAYAIPDGNIWDVKDVVVEENKKQVAFYGGQGEKIVVRLADGQVLEASTPGSHPDIQSADVLDSPPGQWLPPARVGGKVANVLKKWKPEQRLVVKGEKGELKGLICEGASSHEIETWTFHAPAGQKILNIATRNPHESTASIGRVLGDRSVLYKYLNPNTIVVATGNLATSLLTVYLLDTISGQVLTSATHNGVDVSKPVECAISENWFVCTYYGQSVLREDQSQSIRGWQLAITDLYESDVPNYRGSLGDAANFSSLNPIDSPTSPPLPHVISQAFVLGAPLSALATSQTRQGITTRQILAYIPDTHSIIGIPRPILEPRRPVDREPNAAEKEEGLTKYSPAIEVDPRLVITHERDVLGVRDIITCPTILESTSLVFAYGIDIFGTRVTPSFSFDVLGKGFDKVTLITTVAALFFGVFLLAPMVCYFPCVDSCTLFRRGFRC